MKYLYNFGLINNVRTLYKYAISHDMSGRGSKHLSTAADEELADDQLPAGHTPVWIEPPRGATQVQMLESGDHGGAISRRHGPVPGW